MGTFSLAILSMIFAALCTDAAIERSERKVVCYYTTWSFYRPAPYKFTPDQIDPFLCTHVIYAFADIGSKNNIVPADPNFDIDMRGYANITDLKAKNKNLKVMIGVGGWGKLGFERITANETNRKEFAKGAVPFLRQYKFDGLDLNWQNPVFREGGIPEDRENYVYLAQALWEEFGRESMLNNVPKLLLSIAITNKKELLPAYNIPSFNNYMDFISVICYDYHFSFEAAANHHAPLYSLEEDTELDITANANFTIMSFIDQVGPEKLVLGIPTYGRTYKLDDPTDTSLNAYADGPGEKGPFTGDSGHLSYYEICNFVNNEGWTVMQTKPGSAGPYAFKGDQWVGYDDVEMVRHKADYANSKNLGGVMFWTVDFDDFLGKCQESTFPLIRAARDALIPPLDSEVNDNSEEKITSGVEKPKQEQSPLSSAQDIEPTKVEEEYPTTPPPSPAQTTPKDSVSTIRPRTSDVSVQPPNILAELVHLIEKAGGVKKFNEIVRSESDQIPVKESYNTKVDSNNNMVLESLRLPPLLLIMNNSSIYIKEFNIHQKP